MKDSLEYSYRYSAAKMIFGVVAFTGLAASMAYIAHTNDAGLRFYRLVTVPPGVATAIYWGLAVACLVLAVLVAGSVASGISKATFHIRLTPTEFSAPERGFFRKDNITVPMSQIRRIFLQTVHSARFLHVHTPQGKVVVNEADIGEQAFNELCSYLAHYAQGGRS